MAVKGSLAFCTDESMGRSLADVLRQLRAPGAPRIHDLRELGLSGAADEIWMPTLARQDIHVVVTLDSRILKATVRRDVWRAAGLSLFVMDAKWGNLTLFEQARRLIWWWPAIVAQAASGPQGGAWHVPLEMKHTTLRQLFAEPDAIIAR